MSVYKIAVIVFFVSLGLYLLGVVPGVTGLVAAISAFVAAIALAVDK